MQRLLNYLIPLLLIACLVFLILLFRRAGHEDKVMDDLRAVRQDVQLAKTSLDKAQAQVSSIIDSLNRFNQKIEILRGQAQRTYAQAQIDSKVGKDERAPLLKNIEAGDRRIAEAHHTLDSLERL